MGTKNTKRWSRSSRLGTTDHDLVITTDPYSAPRPATPSQPLQFRHLFNSTVTGIYATIVSACLTASGLWPPRPLVIKGYKTEYIHLTTAILLDNPRASSLSSPTPSSFLSCHEFRTSHQTSHQMQELSLFQASRCRREAVSSITRGSGRSRLGTNPCISHLAVEYELVIEK